MYRTLGYGWSNTMLSACGLILSIPITVLLWKYGAKLRNKAGSAY